MSAELKSPDPKERRRKPRDKPGRLLELNLSYRSGGVQTKIVAARVTDLHEEGCGVETGIELPVGCQLTVSGELFGRQRHQPGKVAWCLANAHGGYRAGIEFSGAIQSFKATGSGTSLATILEGEQGRRRSVLTVLYRSRALSPSQPAVSIEELEHATGATHGQLAFTLWYLTERGFVEGSEDGRYWITVAGVDETEVSRSHA